MSFTQRKKGEQSSGLFPGELLERPLITTVTFVPNILLLFNESETRQKNSGQKEKKPFSVQRLAKEGSKKKKKDLFTFSNVKAPLGQILQLVLANVGGLRKKNVVFSR